MFDYNKYRRMREIEDNAQWVLNDMFMLMFEAEIGQDVNYAETINDMSNNLLHLNRLMVAYTQYGDKSEIDEVLSHLCVKQSWSYYPLFDVNTQWLHRAKNATRELAKYIQKSAFRDMGLYLSNNQEENNHLNNELREEYRSVIYQLLECV